MATIRSFPSVRTRRDFLRVAALGGLSPFASRLLPRRLPAAPAAATLFEEVPAAASGITWRHDNAMSPERYLPETVGAGCAFLDYDNDGWMDFYLVNSGPCDFYQPRRPLRNALYKNNRNGTFTDVAEAAGVGGGTFGMGVAGRGHRKPGGAGVFGPGHQARRPCRH